MVEDDDEKTGETGASTRATSMESEIGTVNFQSSHPREQPKTSGLACLALAIVQAGAVIRPGRCEMEEYRTLYYRRRCELLHQKAVQDGEDHRYTVYTTWEVSLKMIEEMSSEAGRDAMELLGIFSFLHHDGISEKMFCRAWKALRSDPTSEWILSHQSDILIR